jgi:AcrR family transcriptional regulator
MNAFPGLPASDEFDDGDSDRKLCYDDTMNIRAKTKTRPPAARGRKTTPDSPPSVPEPSENEAARPVSHRTTVVRNAILQAAAELFAERGYAGTNLRDVADSLGMSRPGLYYHFPSKEKMLEAIVEELTLSGERQLASVAQNHDADPEEALRLVVELTTQWLLDHHIFFRVLDRSEAEIPNALRESNEAAKRTILSHFVGIIDRGIAMGRFRPVDSHLAALAISGMRNWAAWWFKPDGRLSPKEIAAIIAEMSVSSLLRSDAHRSRSERITDVLRILQEDVAHLRYLVKE